MRDTMARVESSRPPGVRSTMTVTVAPRRVGACDHLVDELRGNRMDDPVELGDDGDRRRGGRAAADKQGGREEE